MTFSWPWIAGALIVILGLGFGIGLIHYNGDEKICLIPRHFTWEWKTIAAYKRFEIRYLAGNKDCIADGKMNPDEYFWDATGFHRIDKTD